MSKTKVLITGASGVLGSAVRSAFLTSPDEFHVLGLSYTQKKDGLLPLDIQDKEAISKVVKDFKPKWIIHCAAERRPDVAERDPEAARRLNVDSTAYLAALSAEISAIIIYISTDYVFDGRSPPYAPSAPTNPLNLYGQTKRDGELAILSVLSSGGKGAVLRVPVLYGPAPKNSDTAVNILVDVVKDQSGKEYKMDHFATRFPTNVEDIGRFLVRLTRLPATKLLPPILHYSAAEPYTKYEMCLVFSQILGLPHTHIKPDAAEPTGTAATSRPKNTQLDTSETEALGVEAGLGIGGFEEWWTDYLKR